MSMIDEKRQQSRDNDKVVVYVCPSSSAFVRHHLPVALAAAKKWRVYAILTRDDGKSEEILKYNDIDVHFIELSRKSINPIVVLREMLMLRSILKRLKPDLVNAINLKAVLSSAVAGVKLPGSLIGTIPGLGYMFTGNTFGQWVLRNTTMLGLKGVLRFKKHLLLLSNESDLLELSCRGVTSQEKMCIIPVPGVDTKEYVYTPEPAEGFRVILPARMLWHKGIKEFVEAASKLKHRIPNIECILAGEPDPGNPASVPESMLKSWSEEGIVSWIGWQDDMPALLASCHVVCLPSYYREGFPRSLVEAMFCGRAIVTTDVPGCRDAVKNSQNG